MAIRAEESAHSHALYYGWLVLAASAVAEMLVQGATSYAAGLFVLPLQAEFHISRAAANSPVLIMFVGVALGAPLVGRALDRYPIRWVVGLGAVIFSAGLLAIAFSSSLAFMALMLFVPCAIGFLCLGPMTTATLTARWFWKRRGLALGLAAVATSGGGFTVVPLLSRAIRDHGWRLAMTYEALAMGAIILAVSLLVLRDNPFVAGWADHPENAGREAAGLAERSAAEKLPAREILTSRAFWIPCLVLAGVSGTAQALVVTLVPYGMALGLKATDAAAMISAFAIAAALTKIAAGLLADYLNKRALLIAAALIMTCAWAEVIVFHGAAALTFSAVMAGIALGAALPSVPAVIAGAFGSARVGAVMGWVYLLLGFCATGFSLLIGAIYDRTHNYQPGFLFFSALLAALFLATLLVPLKKPQV